MSWICTVCGKESDRGNLDFHLLTHRKEAASDLPERVERLEALVKRLVDNQDVCDRDRSGIRRKLDVHERQVHRAP